MADTSEPDDVIPTDDQVKNYSKAQDADDRKNWPNAYKSAAPPSSDDTPRPQRKPAAPESGSDANSMDRLMKGASAVSPKIDASSLKADHPYGDGGYSEAPSATMIRLGSGRPYGG